MLLFSSGFGDGKYDGDSPTEELKEEHDDAANDTSHAHTPEFAPDAKGSSTEGGSPLGDQMNPSEWVPNLTFVPSVHC